MTTTHDVPMPEFDWFSPNDCGDKAVWIEEAQRVARAYVDARCEKLQVELDLRGRQFKDTHWLMGEWRKTCEKAEAERDALAEKVKALKSTDEVCDAMLFSSATDEFGEPMAMLIDFMGMGTPESLATARAIIRAAFDAAIDAATGDVDADA